MHFIIKDLFYKRNICRNASDKKQLKAEWIKWFSNTHESGCDYCNDFKELCLSAEKN